MSNNIISTIDFYEVVKVCGPWKLVAIDKNTNEIKMDLFSYADFLMSSKDMLFEMVKLVLKNVEQNYGNGHFINCKNDPCYCYNFKEFLAKLQVIITNMPASDLEQMIDAVVSMLKTEDLLTDIKHLVYEHLNEKRNAFSSQSQGCDVVDVVKSCDNG